MQYREHSRLSWARLGEGALVGMPTGSELHEGPPVPALRPLLHGAPRQLHQHAQRVCAVGGLIARVRGQQQAALNGRRQRAVALQQHMHQGAAQGLRAAQTLFTSVMSVICHHHACSCTAPRPQQEGLCLARAKAAKNGRMAPYTIFLPVEPVVC